MTMPDTADIKLEEPENGRSYLDNNVRECEQQLHQARTSTKNAQRLGSEAHSFGGLTEDEIIDRSASLEIQNDMAQEYENETVRELALARAFDNAEKSFFDEPSQLSGELADFRPSDDADSVERELEYHFQRACEHAYNQDANQEFAQEENQYEDFVFRSGLAVPAARCRHAMYQYAETYDASPDSNADFIDLLRTRGADGASVCATLEIYEMVDRVRNLEVQGLGLADDAAPTMPPQPPRVSGAVSGAYLCGANKVGKNNKDTTGCRRPVAKQGDRCYQHK